MSQSKPSCPSKKDASLSLFYDGSSEGHPQQTSGASFTNKNRLNQHLIYPRDK